MTLSLTTRQQKGPFEKARTNVEMIGNNLYYTLTLNNYMLKLQRMPLPIQITIDDIIQSDFIIGNIICVDVIMQRAQQISA